MAIILLLAATAAIAVIARRFAIPYPIAFVIGGAAIAFLPNMPTVHINPDLIFVLILPPLLFSGGWSTDLEDFRSNRRAILLLATGLVTVTTCLVGFAANALMPELTLAGAFVLGAIVSPPDAVAASSVFERFSVPRRIVTILEGEGLVNDATALVIYGLAVEAVSTGVFHLWAAIGSFFFISLGGLGIGLAAGWLIVQFSRHIRRWDLADSLIDNLFALLGPYTVYLLASSLHVSGVLATVAAGVYMSRRSSEIYNPESRLILSAVWELLIFILNAGVFLLIGLELPAVAPRGADLDYYFVLAAVVSVVVIVARLVWVYPSAYLPFLLKKVRDRENRPTLRGVFVVGWSGMRGIVSLAAALALPEYTTSGAPFPGRSVIIFVTFCVIFVTLVIQGLSLIPILRWLNLDGDDLGERENEVRIAALEAAIRHIRSLEAEFVTTEEWEVASRIVSEYTYRIGHLQGVIEGRGESGEVALDHRLQLAALTAEHDMVLSLRDAGEIPDEIFRKIRYDLDLAQTRLG